MVPVSEPDSGAPLQGVKGPAEDPVGRGAEGDWEVEGPVEDLGPSGRSEVQSGGAGLPLLYGCGEAGASRGGHGERSWAPGGTTIGPGHA